MTGEGPRDADRRKQDTLALLTRPAVDVWVATAGTGDADASQPHLVPVSLAWIDERAVIAVEESSRTARNIAGGGTARLGAGPTHDVVLLDVRLERSLPVPDPAAHELAERYAAQADWDPRTTGPGYRFLVLRPERIQAWREADEIPGRTLMHAGAWLV
ncbi:pyridoxamine 5'-phosphate oxidase family protein [Geodermatophilus sp. TF02-6]|uniref:pyridoxamine 5'-phosphate oxidase family protein n=1 Tax=Geodermatophilus sp. TF02-6 TaxID=2250575 RepID=UPI000DE9411F|nr:pyridoxamine 5'-phosphate oxidase family protein [Geodermatophilus sp. TF02-6]RBY80536.1 pyridoxamine 5'-phosphate oxidase family protein [Geodermatophilus sp. TF02-6]